MSRYFNNWRCSGDGACTKTLSLALVLTEQVVLVLVLFGDIAGVAVHQPRGIGAIPQWPLHLLRARERKL